MDTSVYFPESDDETLRLDVKTNVEQVKQQVIWAGVKPGKRVADFGCGAGITSSILQSFTGESGEVIGVDYNDNRIQYAQNKYAKTGLSFIKGDIREDLSALGKFDLIWIRFVLEYYKKDAEDIVKKASQYLNPGGTLCLIDLDYNCLSHYKLPDRLEKVVVELMKLAEAKLNFDPYVGRKLYSLLYHAEFNDLDVSLAAHHLIYGELKDHDAFNWFKKLAAVLKHINYPFNDYNGGYEEFYQEAIDFFYDPARFTYTPVICCKGIKV